MTAAMGVVWSVHGGNHADDNHRIANDSSHDSAESPQRVKAPGTIDDLANDDEGGVMDSAPRPRRAPSFATMPARESLDESSYLVQRDRVLAQGIDALPAPEAGATHSVNTWREEMKAIMNNL
jgi:hypothetical protein